MRRSMFTVFALGSLLALAAPASAQVKLASDWEETFAEAKERNVPVLYLLGREKKAPWIQWFKVPIISNYLNDRCLVVVAHRGGGHEAKTIVNPKTKEETLQCPLYEQWDCGVHKSFYDDYAGNYDYKDLPAGFILRPDQSEAVSGCAALSPKKLIEKLKEVQFAMGEGVFKSEIKKLEKQLSKGDEKLKKGKFKAARKTYEKHEKKVTKKHLKSIVAKRFADLDKAALEAVEAARGLGAGKRHNELKRIAREMKGREPGEVAKKALAELEGGS